MPTTIGSTTFPTGSATTFADVENARLRRQWPRRDKPQAPGQRRCKFARSFQDFSAGTFYKEMLKSLRSGQKHSKYFYGGQAEEIFRGQMDQQIAEDLARQHGGAFSNPLFEGLFTPGRVGSVVRSAFAWGGSPCA